MEAPTQTLYINNLNEKIKKEILKKTLHSLFSQYGRIVEIVACKGIKLRGQVISAIIHIYIYKHKIKYNLLIGMASVSRCHFSNKCHAKTSRI